MTEHVIEVGAGDVVRIRAAAGAAFGVEVEPLAVAPVEEVPVEEVPAEDAPSSLWQDVRAAMPRNLDPDEPSRGSWWQRTAEEIDGITVHHTLATDYMATAAYCTRPVARGGKGYPTTQYHFWVMPDGTVLYLLDVLEGCWHDHAGDKNRHISVGMAGRFDKTPPSAVQLQATARLVAALMGMYGIARGNVRGHCDWAKLAGVSTVCPGWEQAGWKAAFFEALDVVVANG